MKGFLPQTNVYIFNGENKWMGENGRGVGETEC
jgi:hypothetical protein